LGWVAVFGRIAAIGLAMGLGTVDAQTQYPEVVIHVDVSSVVADDTNAGTATRPLASLAEGLRRAVAHRESGVATQVLVHPGTYREALTGTYMDEGGPPIVIEASAAGRAVVSGSDVWTDWHCQGAVCTHDWPFAWGFEPLPWPVDAGPVTQRREMVFMDGEPLEQRLDRSDVLTSPGTFHVDEGVGELTLHVPEGSDMSAALVEVAVRPQLLRLQGLDDLTIRGLVFQHASTPAPFAAVDIVDQERVSLENVTVRWNSWGGIDLKGSDYTVRDSVATHNGGGGINGFMLSNVLLEGNESSYNNWRGHAGGLTGWAVGDKFLVVRDVVFRDHVAVGNLTRGLWLDYDVADVRIERLRACDNLTDGLFVEATQGPIAIVDSVFCNNGRAGIRTSATSNLELRGNRIEGNGEAQVAISGDLDVVIPETIGGRALVLNNETWRVVGNVLRATGDGLVISTTLPREAWYDLMTTAYFGQNDYVHTSQVEVFQVYGGRRLSFESWQREMLQDISSSFRIE
jgi:hypothetical protein